MGVNLCIETLDGQEHPDWDPFINGGHKQFAREIFGKLPYETHRKHPDPWYDDSEWYRPTDFDAWREALKGFVNEDLFMKMIDILESDDRYWLYISQ